MTLTKGFSSRGEPTWMARATTSFSLPVSPSMSTGDEVGAPMAMRSESALVAGLWPAIWPKSMGSRCSRSR